MPSFFDKLKKGMNIESNFEEPEEEMTSISLKKQKSVAQKKSADSRPAVKLVKNETAKAKIEKKKKEKEVVFAVQQNEEESEVVEDTPITTEPEEEVEEKEEIIAPKEEKKQPEVRKESEKVVEQKPSWFQEEGELVVDIYQTENELVVQSAVAGIRPEELDIDIENDMLIIKGCRKNTGNEKKDYFFQECYWGPFSRQIVLPVEVDSGRVKAEMREGVLTIRMPKIIREGKNKISVESA